MSENIVVLVTCGSVGEARKIGRALVEERLAACVNISQSPIESIYRWKGRVDTAPEFLMTIKTVTERFSALEERIKKLHSYDVPEIIALPVAKGSRQYLSWLTDSVRAAK